MTLVGGGFVVMRSRCVDTDEMKDGITEGCSWCDGYCKIWVGRVAVPEIDSASRRCCDHPGVADEGWSAVGWERHRTIVMLGSNNREEWSYVEEQCWRRVAGEEAVMVAIRCRCRRRVVEGGSDGGSISVRSDQRWL
ncbi:hypothetical protein BHE74_00051883, partial [Ensete ventricosum]